MLMRFDEMTAVIAGTRAGIRRTITLVLAEKGAGVLVRT